MLNMDITREIRKGGERAREKKEEKRAPIFYLYEGTNVATVCNAIYARANVNIQNRFNNTTRLNNKEIRIHHTTTTTTGSGGSVVFFSRIACDRLLTPVL